MVRLQLVTEVKLDVSCVSAKPVSHVTYTYLCYGDNNRQTTEINAYIFFIMCCGWINHKQHFFHLKVVNAIDGKFSVNSILEILHISSL